MDEFKVCPRCQHKSSQAKNYCDRCGTEFAAHQPPPAGPDAFIPQTLIMRPSDKGQAAAPPPGLSLPQAGHSQQVFAPIPTPAPRASPPRTVPPSKPSSKPPRAPFTLPFLPSGLGYFMRSVASILVLLFFAFGLILVGLQQLQSHSPKATVARAAQRYLAFMSAGDYIDAYDMLSLPAKASCKQDDFRLLLPTTSWTWADARVVTLEPEAAVVEYDVAEPGHPTRPDYVSFVLEASGWSRPFNRGLTQDAKVALETGHPDMAFLKAQEAIGVDPRDPLARALLCEATYARRLPEEIERECGLALETARKYPSSLGGPALYRMYAMLAQTLHANRQFTQAAEAYTAMLAFPRISDDDVCRLSFARADAYAQLGQAAQAGADLDRAVSACANPADKAAASRRKAALARSGGR